MKKIMFAAAMAALVFSACSKSEVVEQSTRGAINFESFVGKATKAQPVTAFADGNKMTVWGYSSDAAAFVGDAPIKNLNGVEFTRSAGKWDSGLVAYWVTGKYHHFFAAVGSTIDAAGLATVTVEDNIESQKDILVAEPLLGVAYKDAPTAQTFVFRHVLSQVKFTATFTGAYEDATNIKITKIAFKPSTGGFNNVGSIDVPAYTAGSSFSYKAGATGAVSQYVVIPDNGGVAVTEYNKEIPVPHAISDVAMVLPQTPAAKLVIDVTVAYTDAKSATQEKIVTITSKDDFAWESNKVYNYKFTIDVIDNILGYKQIEIGDPSIKPWDTTENTPEF